MSEDTGRFLLLLFWADNLNKLFTVMGRKFKFSAQDRFILEKKNHPVSTDIIPPLLYLQAWFLHINIYLGTLVRYTLRITKKLDKSFVQKPGNPLFYV